MRDPSARNGQMCSGRHKQYMFNIISNIVCDLWQRPVLGGQVYSLVPSLNSGLCIYCPMDHCWCSLPLTRVSLPLPHAQYKLVLYCRTFLDEDDFSSAHDYFPFHSCRILYPMKSLLWFSSRFCSVHRLLGG